MSAKKNTRKSRRKVFPAWGWLLIAAAAVGLVYLLFQPGNPTSAKLPREVSVAQAAALQDEGAFIVDVREPSEWEQGAHRRRNLDFPGSAFAAFRRAAHRPDDCRCLPFREPQRAGQGTSSKQQDLRRSHPWAAG
jgi:Rhodanese-related sulfurtransferase